jgi:serine phosphatase RsbU (regulator of sigma subunit)
MQKDHQQILEYKGDNQPVGNYIAQSDFTNHEILLKEGDTCYMVTDGFQDQFGGERDKKFGSTRLKRLLSDMQHLSLSDQKTELDRALNEWMGSNRQIDDITILGFRFKRTSQN